MGVLAEYLRGSERIEMGYRVVVAGATGNVGREMLNILAEREFPIDEIAALASARSQGDEIDFGETGKKLKVQNIEHFDPTGWDIALFATGSGGRKTQPHHHRDPDWCDREDGGEAEAAPRGGEDQARRRRALPVGLRRGQGGDGRA